MAEDSELYEKKSYAFVVKVWLKQNTGDDMPAKWGGRITEVLSGKYSYFEELDGIITFIEPYLERSGNHFSPISRFFRWLARLTT